MTDVAARREARRKRILENSEFRLRRIASLHQDHTDHIGDNGPKHNINAEPSIPLLNSYSTLQPDDNVDTENQEINSLFLNKELGVREATDVPVTNKYRKLLVIIFIILLTKSLLILCSSLLNVFEECMYINAIFLPFLFYELIDILVIRSRIKENHFLNTLLFLSNVPTKYTCIIVRFFSIFGAIMQDTFLYVFVFIVVEIAFSMLLGV